MAFALAATNWGLRYLQPRWVIRGLFVCSLLAYLALIPAPRVDGQL